MKKNLKQSVRPRRYNLGYSLGDLIRAVSARSNSDRETVSAVATLLESGKVRLTSGGQMFRVRVW